MVKKIILLVVLLIGEQQVNAQLFKKLKDGIKNKLDKVGKEQLEGVFSKEKNKNNDSSDEIGEDTNKNQTKEYEGDVVSTDDYSSEGEMVSFADQKYFFDTIITYIMKSDLSVSNLEIKMYLSSNDDSYYGSESAIQVRGKLFTIHDHAKDLTISLTDFGTTKIKDVVKQSKDGKENKSMFDIEFDESLKTTGRTKQILGYTCEEYFMNNNGDTIRIWATSEIKSSVAKSKKLKGWFLEMYVYNKKLNMNYSVIGKQINKEFQKTISTADYKL